MTQPPKRSPAPRPRAASPAERSEEFASHQQKLKEEAAERRAKAASKPSPPPRPRHSANP